MTTLGSPRLEALIGQQVELAYSRIDADGSLREVRISAVDISHTSVAASGTTTIRIADYAPQPLAANPGRR